MITVRKALKQLRTPRAEKRGGKLNRKNLEAADNIHAEQVCSAMNTLSPQEFDLYSEELLTLLDESVRPFAILRLMNHANQEIADIMECSNKTVQRKLDLIRLAWQSELDDE